MRARSDIEGMKIQQALQVRPDGLLIAGLVMVLVLALVHGSGWSEELGDLGGDSAEYLLLAQSLAAGQGYRDLYLPGGPAHAQYPFGWPLLLMPLQWLPGNGFGGEHLLVLALGVLAGILAFRWMRGEAGRAAAWIGLGILGLAPAVVEATGQLRSEIPCLAFGWLTILALDRYARAERWKDRRLWVAAALGAVTTLIRTAGVAFIVGGALFLIARRAHRDRAHKAIAFFGLALLPVLAWMLRNHLVGGTSSSYFDQLLLSELYTHDAGQIGLLGFLERILENVSIYAKLIGWTLVAPVVRLAPHGESWMMLPAIAAALGYGVRFWERRGAAEWIVPLYLGVLLVWPWSGPRFLIPILPAIVFYAVAGVGWLARRWVQQPRRTSLASAALAIVAVLTLVGNAFESSPRVRARFDEAQIAHGEHFRLDFAGYSEYSSWRQANMVAAAQHVWAGYLILGEIARQRGGGRVMCRKPRLTALLNRVPTTGIPLEDDPERFLAEIERTACRFVLLDAFAGLSQRYLQPTIEWAPTRFDPIERIGSSILYEVRFDLTASPK